MPVVNPKITTLPTLNIPSGGTASNAIAAEYLVGLQSITFMAPAALTGTVAVQVAVENPDDNGSTGWVTLQSPPGTAVTVAAGAATVVAPGGGSLPFYGIRLLSSGAEAALRTFRVIGGR